MAHISDIVDNAMKKANIRIKRNVLNTLLDILPEETQEFFWGRLWISGVPDDKLDHALLQCENTIKRLVKESKNGADSKTDA